jgi:phospholipase/carboxylesterase
MSTSTELEIIALPATSPSPTGVMVLLHGWGANHQDLVELAPYFNLPEYQFICPNGLFEHPFSDIGRMWYSFTGAGELTDRSISELATSRKVLTDWMRSLPEYTGVPLSRTWIGGFSQGGAMSLDLGLNLPVAGVIVLSGYLHPDRQSTSPTPPILIVHGTQDEVVPLAAARRTRNTLQDRGIEVNYQEFDMGHTIVPQVLAVVRNFVTNTGAKDPQ